MKWVRPNGFPATFPVVFGLLVIAALVFLWRAKSGFDDAQTRWNESATELARLQRLTPFPTETNLEKMKTQATEYAAALEKLKADLKTHALPVKAMAPNEFQARLNQARAALSEKARAGKVKLPEPFFLGFEEFAAALPDTAAAPLLGQELAQAELLLNLMIDAHIDAITSFRRIAPNESIVPAAPPPAGAHKPAAAAAAPSLLERESIEVGFVASPSATRRALNQIATNSQQFYLVRALQILNEKEKGPAREVAGAATAASPAPANAALNFIVGNEHLQTAARIEMLRFAY